MPKREGLQTIENQDAVKAKQPWWLVLGWVMIGLGLDWRCAFKWFSGSYPFFSQAVLRRMSLIVVSCAIVAFIAVRVSSGARWRDAGALFCLVSLLVSEFLIMSWI
jgi:hypothetical protein